MVVTMKERPIIFSTEMVKAILDDKKTQTRRVVTPSTSEVGEGKVDWSKFCWDGSQIYQDTCHHGHTEEHKAPMPFVDGRASESYPYEHQYLHIPYNWREDMTVYRIYPQWEVGDRLWVRETFLAYSYLTAKQDIVRYKADNSEKTLQFPKGYKPSIKWRPSIFMPRWASRITLEVTGVRVGRLAEILWMDIIHEGLNPQGKSPNELKHEFIILWNSLNAKRGYSWETNPYCWVIEFRKVS